MRATSSASRATTRRYPERHFSRFIFFGPMLAQFNRSRGRPLSQARVRSHNVCHNLFQLAIAILANDAKRVLGANDEFRFDGFLQIRDAIRVRATQDPDRSIRQREGALLRDVIVADHIHRGRRRDQGDHVDLERPALPVLDLDDVFPSHGSARDMHRDGDRRGHGVTDPEDLQDLEGQARGDVVDHRAVLDRRDPQLPHSAPPRMRSRRAMRTGTALEACLKYTACFVRSTSGAISVSRGSGCMMMRPRFASRRRASSTRYDPATASYSCGSGNRSRWMRVTYKTSASRMTSSSRCVTRKVRPRSFTCSRISRGISRVGGLTNVRWAPSSARAYVREWTVRPYLRSPTKVTFCPWKAPFSSQIVYRSRRVCVGC